MGEMELRVAALETALMELIAWLPTDAVDDTMRSIKAGLDIGCVPDEKTIRLGALQILDEGRRRFEPMRILA